MCRNSPDREAAYTFSQGLLTRPHLLRIHLQNTCVCMGVRVRGIAPAMQVRNAATLTYVALVARLLGLKNTGSESNSRRPAMSLQAFLCAYPSLASFLLEHLATATRQTAASHASTPHPHLHPILLLFANMQRSDGEARAGSVSSPGPAVTQIQDIIQQCLSMPSLAVRTLAARALAMLCPSGGLPGAVEQQLEAVSEHPARLLQQRADAVHGALLAVHHMLLNALPPCSIEECSSTLEVAAPMLKQRLWLLQQSLCPCAAVSREFAHVLEAFGAAHSASVSSCDGDSSALSNETEKMPRIVGVNELALSLDVQSVAAPALVGRERHGSTQHMPMQDLWSQSMARLSFYGANYDQDVTLGAAVHAIQSQSYCLRIEGFKWLASTDVLQLESRVQRLLADELWAAIRKETNQIALAAALEAAVCSGGGLDVAVCPRGPQIGMCLSEQNVNQSGDAALQHWLVSLGTAAVKRLQIITEAAAQHGNDQNISQQVLKCTAVLLRDMIDACSLCGVHLQNAFLDSTFSQCVPLLE
jgi:hypothetical protein